MESQISEEYATEVSNRDFIEESNLEENKNNNKKINKNDFKKIIAKVQEKHPVARLQLQPITQLASGLNTLTDQNAKQLKMEEKVREALLQLKKKELKKIAYP